MKRYCFQALCLVGILTCCAPLWVCGQNEEPFCQILDNSVDPVWDIALTFIPERRFSGFGKSSILEFDASTDIVYYRDVLAGTVDAVLDFSLFYFPDSARLALPDQLVELSVDAGMTWRYVGGWALQVRAAPGIYSDAEEIDADALAMPVSALLVYSFSPAVSGLLGFEYRASWETEVVPLIEVAWAVSDQLRIEAGFPKSQAVLAVDDVLSMYAAFAWDGVTYARDDDHGDLSLEDYRSTLGMTYGLSGETQFICELGYVFNREVEANDETVSIDSTPYIRFGVTGPF